MFPVFISVLHVTTLELYERMNMKSALDVHVISCSLKEASLDSSVYHVNEAASAVL